MSLRSPIARATPIRVHRERCRRDGYPVAFAYRTDKVILDQRGPVINKALSHSAYSSGGGTKGQ